MNSLKEKTVGEIAAEHPLATRVFARHHIDYCCGGGQKLQDVCLKKELDSDKLIKEIEKELESPNLDSKSWLEAPLKDLITHILLTYHRPLDEELPRLAAMAEKVHEVHREKDPRMLGELLSTFLALKAELEEHMRKEEEILFPLIQSGQGAMADGPISVMHQEHDAAGIALARLRELTHDYRIPEEACNTWQALWKGLEALEESLHQHIHLENNILFPRALEVCP
jgi:regulator of cell morphogenesis and NO signaling